MVAFELKTKQDIQDFATGCCFFGCGGGGDPEAGIVALTEVLEKGKPLQVTSFDDLKDDDTYASVFLMGSIAPKTDEIIAKQKRNGVPVDLPRRCFPSPWMSWRNTPGRRSAHCLPLSWAAETAACPCPLDSTRA